MTICEKLASLFVIMLVALIPAIVLYLLFPGQSDASLMSTGVRVGGPAAFFFIVMHAGIKFLVNIRSSDEELRLQLRRRMHKLLVGHWSFIATVQIDGKAVKMTGSANIGHAGENDIMISGHWHNAEHEPEGAWNADEVILTKRKLIFVYMVGGGAGAGPMTGLTNLNVEYDQTTGAIEQLTGYYGVLGASLRGTTVWTKTPGHRANPANMVAKQMAASQDTD